MIGLDPVVRVLGGVMERVGHEFAKRSCARRCPIGHNLARLAVRADRRYEEPARGSDIATGRDVHVDDLAVLVDRPVHVPPPAGDLHIRLVHKPTIPDDITARPCRVDQQRGEALHPPEDRHVIDFDARSTNSSSTSRYDRPYRKYQRTASTMISGGNRNPANAEDAGRFGRQAWRRVIPPLSLTPGSMQQCRSWLYLSSKGRLQTLESVCR